MSATLQRTNSQWIELGFLFLFFFNTFLLPEGLSYSLLLVPIWIYLLSLHGKAHLLVPFTFLFLIWATVHFYHGVALSYYIISVLLMAGTVIFAITAWYYINIPEIDLDQIFKRIALLNFVFTVLSIGCLLIPFLKPSVWYIMSMSENIKPIPRLKLFTSEASHYSYLLAPIVIYFYCKAIFLKSVKPVYTLLLVTIPLLLSLSFGVLSCLIITALLVFLFYFRAVFDTKTKVLVLIASLSFIVLLLAFLYRFYPHNILFLRFQNVFNGKDTSARGRTYESFILADLIIGRKSALWGIGPGQLKVFGREIIIQYYLYSAIPSTIRIPNACAETMVCFGYIGLFLRLGIQLFLFIRTKVYRNPFRCWLFLFLFMFQFMGSYITNPAEYVFWILAFSPVFKFLDKDKRKLYLAG